MGEGIDYKGLVSIDGEEYIPRREYDDLSAIRDRLADEVEELQRKLAEREGPAE